MGSKFMLQQAEPPPVKRGRRREYQAALQSIIDTPKQHAEWMHLTRYDSKTGARDTLKRIRNGRIKIPSGEWEFRARKGTETETPFSSDLYVRYAGPIGTTDERDET